MRNVAVDLGGKKTTYCEVSQGKVVQRATVSHISALESLLGPETGPAKVAIEACREAWHVHDQLVEWGNEVVLVDTTRSRQIGIGQHGRKTDRIDAEALAFALARGGVPKAHVLSPARRELRRVLGVRRALVESRAQLVTTARGLVRERGERIAGCATDVFATRARAAKLSAESQQLIEPLLGVIEQLDTELKGVEGQLAVLCDQEPVVSVCSLRCQGRGR